MYFFSLVLYEMFRKREKMNIFKAKSNVLKKLMLFLQCVSILTT
jgi:hypothetical protein